MGFALIETRRLVLRPPTKDDIAQLTRLMNDPGIARFYGDVRYPCTPLSVWKWFKRPRTNNRTGYVTMPYVAVMKSNPRLIVGSAHITITRSGRYPLIGYWVAKEYRRKRFASEITRSLTGTIFNEVELDFVVATCETINAPSQRVLRAIGFERVRYTRIYYMDPRRSVSGHLYRLSRQNWKGHNKGHRTVSETLKEAA